MLTSFDTEPPAVCTSMGTEMAYLLSSTRKRTGNFRLLALFNASQNSPSLVVPSPHEQYTRSSSTGFSARNHASAQPTAWRNWVPVGLDWLTMLSAL